MGRVGPEHRSSRRGRGEQRRPLRRRVGNMGACPPPLRGRSAVLSPNAADPSGGPKMTRMSISTRRAHGGITSPCARQVGASLRRPQRSERYMASYSESSFRAKSHTGGFWGAAHPLTEGVQKECTEECTEGLNEKKAACALTGWLYGPQGMPRHRAQAARSLCLAGAVTSTLSFVSVQRPDGQFGEANHGCTCAHSAGKAC